MSIPPEIRTLVNRLNQELDETEQEATDGLNLLRPILSRFLDNATLIQFFAYFNTAVFFVADSRRRVNVTVEMILPVDVTAEEIQDAGEELGTLLGQVLETKIGVRRIINILRELP